ncbi:MAG: ATP-binding protein [Verrucomicrobiota bacterium JB022]|nr:ATP-binding protein [Verrucomicrobiota bacterium JB022]
MRLSFLTLIAVCVSHLGWGQGSTLSKEDLVNAVWHYHLESALAEPEKVYKLDLSRQGLEAFPLEVTGLPNLRILLLNHNRIAVVPPEIGRLQKLVELELNDNELEELPPELFTIGTLSELEASRNRIRELPAAVAQLHQLTEIELNENRLTRLPDEVGQLTELEELKVARNQLTELPASILELDQLGELVVGSNQLSHLWPDIDRLRNLRDLDISNNNLRELPAALFDFHLSLLFLKNNPFAHPLTEEQVAAVLHAEENDFDAVILSLAEAGDAVLAERYLDFAQRYFEEHKLWGDLAAAYLTAAFVYRDLGQLELAVDYTNRAEALAEEVNFDLLTADDDEAFYANTTEIIRDAQNLQELLHSEHEKATLRRNVRWGMIAGMALLMGFSAFVYWSRRRLQRYNRELAEQRRQIAEQAEALELANDHLTARQGEILAQNERIEAQAADLRRLNATKDRIFSIVGHDLRNPLYAIESVAELIEDEQGFCEPQEQQRRAQVIQRSAQEASQLLHNLLDWARTQTNDIPYRPGFVQPGVLVDSTLDLLLPSIQRKRLLIDSRIAPHTVVYADPHMLQTVFRNLIGNAIKFSHEGGRISVCERQSESWHEFEIADEGVGMEQGVAKGLLRQTRIHSATGTRGEKGSGLGLLICREFIARNEGMLEIDSAPQQGTRFVVRLPLVGLALAVR